MSSRRQRNIPLGGRYRQVYCSNNNKSNVTGVNIFLCTYYFHRYFQGRLTIIHSSYISMVCLWNEATWFRILFFLYAAFTQSDKFHILFYLWKWSSLCQIMTWRRNPSKRNCSMMTSSNGKIFRVTGHLCGDFTGHRWIPHTKASDAELWGFLSSAPELTAE